MRKLLAFRNFGLFYSFRSFLCRSSRRFLIYSFILLIFVCMYFIFLRNESYSIQGRSTKNIHKLCLIVPFRNAFDELLKFIPHMDTFLKHQHIDHYIYVINQVDELRFNRGSLLNAGFKLALGEVNCDYIALHDVDLLPLNPQLLYAFPGERVLHISSSELHPMYHYRRFLGGIVLMSVKTYEKVNGMSNKYWGWGNEDDEFYTRLMDKKIPISRPENISTNQKNTFEHFHPANRVRDMIRCHNQSRENLKRDRFSGLHNVSFKLARNHTLTIDNIALKVFDVFLNCNRSRTPWCVCRHPKVRPKSKSV